MGGLTKTNKVLRSRHIVARVLMVIVILSLVFVGLVYGLDKLADEMQVKSVLSAD